MMGFYSEKLVPWLIHWGMQNKEAKRLRQHVVPRADGRVLEIGIGSGLNLPYYNEIESLQGLDPSAVLLSLAMNGRSRVPFTVTLLRASAEAIPFATGTFDSVVTTWTLCSIPDAPGALVEMRRVLKPNGKLLFVEHGRSADPGVARWQDRLDPLWHRCSGGCHMNRDVPALIRGAGFLIDQMESGYLVRGPRVLAYHFEGRARPL